MQSLRLPQWRACFPNSRNFTALLVRLMDKLRSGHITPGLRSRAKDNKTKARLHRKETGDQHGMQSLFQVEGLLLHDIPSTRRQAVLGTQERLDEDL